MLKDDALMCCATSNRIRDEDVARRRVLLECGVDGCQPRQKYTPLYMAKIRKKVLLEKVLREFGAKE